MGEGAGRRAWHRLEGGQRPVHTCFASASLAGAKVLQWLGLQCLGLRACVRGQQNMASGFEGGGPEASMGMCVRIIEPSSPRALLSLLPLLPLQAGSNAPSNLALVKQLESHPAFNINNPNNCYRCGIAACVCGVGRHVRGSDGEMSLDLETGLFGGVSGPHLFSLPQLELE